jgi:hypothetical protein
VVLPSLVCGAPVPAASISNMPSNNLCYGLALLCFVIGAVVSAQVVRDQQRLAAGHGELVARVEANLAMAKKHTASATSDVSEVRRHTDVVAAQLLETQNGACREGWMCPTMSILHAHTHKERWPSPMEGWLHEGIWNVQDRCNTSTTNGGRPSYRFDVVGSWLSYAQVQIGRKTRGDDRRRDAMLQQLKHYAGPKALAPDFTGHPLFLWYSTVQKQWLITISPVGNHDRIYLALYALQ